MQTTKKIFDVIILDWTVNLPTSDKENETTNEPFQEKVVEFYY